MKVSDPKVMKSNAGYYIGTSCIDDDCDGMEFPYQRLSGYFKSAAVAIQHLKYYNLVKA